MSMYDGATHLVKENQGPLLDQDLEGGLNG